MTISAPNSAPVEDENAGEKPSLTDKPLSPEAQEALKVTASAQAERLRIAEAAGNAPKDGKVEEAPAPETPDAPDSPAADETPAAPAEDDGKPKSWWLGLFSSLSAGFTSASTWLGEKGGKFGDWLGELLGLKPKDDKASEAAAKPEATVSADANEKLEITQVKNFEEDMKALMEEFGLSETEDKRQNFFKVAMNLGKEVEAKYGIPHQVVIAQACLESGFGQSGLTQKALNCFGYKTGSSDVPYITMQTVEYRNGVKGEEPAKFRAYSSLRESFMDYGALLYGASRYKTAFEHTKEPKRFLQEVIKGGYATDPNYLAKAEQAISSYGLSLS